MVFVGGVAARQLAMGLGCIYPLYASTEALKSGKQRELQQWVTFWYVHLVRDSIRFCLSHALTLDQGRQRRLHGG